MQGEEYELADTKVGMHIGMDIQRVMAQELGEYGLSIFRKQCQEMGVKPEELKIGDLLVWEPEFTGNEKTPGHTAFYAGDGKIFHAHGETGTPAGFTTDLKRYWIPRKGLPDVYRQSY